MATKSGSTVVRISSTGRLKYAADRDAQLRKTLNTLNDQGKRVINIIDGPLMPFGPVGNVYCDVTILWEKSDDSTPMVNNTPAPATVGTAVHINENNLGASMTRAKMFLEDHEWDTAQAYFNGILDIDPTYADAYIGLYMAEKNIEDDSAFLKFIASDQFDGENKNIKKALKFNCAISEKIQNAIGQFKERVRTAEEQRKKEDEEVESKKQLLTSFCQNYGFTAISAGGHHTVGLREDGTVIACGENDFGQCKVSDWRNIIAVSAGAAHTVGLKADGTVIACGKNDFGQCKVSDWRNIIAVSAGGHHTVGLKADGTVIACGMNRDGRCDVSSWRNIIAVSAGTDHTVGLREDNTVIACGKNNHGECNVFDWRNIIAVSAGDVRTVGLREDGTVIACGGNNFGKCDVSGWRNIIAVSVGFFHTVGLKADGTVIASCGGNDFGQSYVSGWRNIIAVSAGATHTVGLREDGTVIACGGNTTGKCDVYSWKLFESWESLENAMKKKQAAIEKIRHTAEKVAEEERIAAEQGRLTKIKKLGEEKAKLQEDLPNIKGLFAGSKKREIESRIAAIDAELEKLND